MKKYTLLFLIQRDSDNKVVKILLAMKKRGFGMGNWNGVGGKVESSESVEQACVREAKEEIGVTVNIEDLTFVANNIFEFKEVEDINKKFLDVDVFTAEKWQGDIQETEEMRPEWFTIDDIPYDTMWDDDKYWLPEIINDKKIKTHCLFDKDSKVIDFKSEFII